MSPASWRIAILLPCYNEQAAIAQTIAGFRAALPEAVVFVYDNNSQDRTAQLARDAGAVVRSEGMQGKGNVVRRMFADVEADIYVMADGDSTYDSAVAPAMVKLLLDERLDMVVGTRAAAVAAAYRGGHVIGNRVFTAFLANLFGRSFTDIFSGYRVFSRRFVKSFPVLSSGFEIETEMSVHALELRMPVGELATRYNTRPEGSTSKLSTYRDGWRILRTMGSLYRSERPALFYGLVAGVLTLASLDSRISSGGDVLRNRPRSPPADRDPRHRYGHSRCVGLLCRAYSRYGHTWQARTPPPRLSLAARAERRSPPGLKFTLLA